MRFGLLILDGNFVRRAKFRGLAQGVECPSPLDADPAGPVRLGPVGNYIEPLRP